MAVFLLKDPDAVFIHIPKTAGLSIRVGAWQGRYEGPVRGHVPAEWETYFKFAFVRHPVDRLISAWLMFSAGRRGVPEVSRNRLLSLMGIEKTSIKLKMRRPLFPGMSLAEFLKIAADDSIALEDPSRGPQRRKGTLRRHAIPQTHTFHCIDKADFIGRFENLDAEMNRIRQRLGAELPISHSNKTENKSDWRSHFTPALFDEAVEFYREDFRRFDYPIPRLRD